MEYWSTIPRVMMIFHLWNKRLIFTSEEIPASEEVFASTAELYSVNFSLSPLLWNYGIAVFGKKRSKIRVRIMHRRALYTGKYGIRLSVIEV